MKSFILLILALTVVGCAVTPVERSLDDESVSAVRNATVYVIIPQKKVLGTVVRTDTGGQFGMIGSVLDDYETSKKYRWMLGVVKPIQDVTDDLNFKKDYISALKKSRIFLNSKNIKLVTHAPQSHEERVALVKGAQSREVILIDVEYVFDISYKTFLTNSQIELWKKTDGSPAHVLTSSYQSHPITLDNSYSTWKNASKLWPKKNGKKYRKYYKEGISNSIKMLKIAVLERPSNLPEPGSQVYAFTDYRNQYHHIKEGKILRAKGNRAVVLTSNGDYFSVSTGPTFKSASKSLAKVPNNKGRVFLFRTTEKEVASIQPDILINGKMVGQFIHGAFLYKDLRPGNYTVSLVYTGDDPGSSIAKSQISDIKPVKLIVKKGSSYYVKFEGYKGLFTSEDALKIIQPGIAKQEITPLFLN